MANAQAKAFIEKWTDRGNEKQETQQFWNGIILDVLGAPKDTVIEYEKPVKINGQTKFIDAYLLGTRTLIEQKSLGVDLMKAETQSDGTKLTPYEQGRRYGGYLPYDEQPRWIIDSNFAEIRVHDMKKPGEAPEIIYLKDLEKDYTRLNFIISTEDEHLKKEFEVSVKAGEIVGILYDKLLTQYKDPSEHDLQSLNRLCVRIVFCLYAEDAGLFGNNTHAFHDYMAQFNGPARFRNGLKEFFNVLNTPIDERDPYLDPELMAFPYVNGGLFADDSLALPFFTDEILDIILEKASADFDWSDISPTIFGAIFESTLNPETRRSGGMHYTSIENIHKVIDPLFLDDLKAELASIKAEPVDKTRNKKFKDFQTKLASLRWLDPAAGSGNFLTETYLCVRRLENEVISDLHKGQIMMAFDETPNPIKVSITQFYGIEINDFACATAQTALWIAEAKMMKETETLVNQDFEFFPLTTNANIVEGNALRMDWNDVVPASQVNFIMGNPPFVGFTFMTEDQKADMQMLFPKVKNLDLVCGWYKVAKDYIAGTDIQCAFVSTNSIAQGETVARLWSFLEGIHIIFAYRTFIWSSEASNMAHVHCIILGFSMFDKERKLIFDDKGAHIANNINPYLYDAPDVIVTSRNQPICDVPQMIYGNKPADGGNLIIEADEYEEFIKANPKATKYVRQMLGASEFLHNKKRYCLWLEDADPSEVKQCPGVMDRIEKCRQVRANSIAQGIRKFADTPMLFAQRTQPVGETYIIVPRHSSENRRYIPFGFIRPDVIVNDAVQIIPRAGLYHFGIMESNVHMAWVRVVCGRIKSDYRYSKDIVYNNFPWPTPTDEQKAKIEATAQGILNARAKYPNASLADLYDELTMPIELRKAHQANDRAVMGAYGFSVKMTEQECVAELMKMYQSLVESL
ncbi:MAG: class I SAM-dependent DNA methyltransferase [Oscillospiraceae bacterium]|nr:class I SAM-dependent DNA methyltransferase [Oscillospiraceae bacterium]